VFNLITCRVRIDEGQYQFDSKEIKGISQATVISVPTDACPTFRTGAIGG